MVFKEDYPRHPPTVTFLSDTVFHPLISQDGKMSLKSRFRTWMLVTIFNQSRLNFASDDLDSGQAAGAPCIRRIARNKSSVQEGCAGPS